MRVVETEIKGVDVVETAPVEDHRGSFARLFCELDLSSVMRGRRIVQINHSRTRAVGAVRGMHFQLPPHAEMKLVRCLKGRVWDVAVDLRAGSATLLQWHARELTPRNAHMLVIPEGCAHGFQALEAESELLYLHTASYVPAAERGVAHDDPQLSIAWPLPVTDLSARDRAHQPLPPGFAGLDS
jgi:dTDP-4-dehydrorhamnose 3,5-epimerase